MVSIGSPEMFGEKSEDEFKQWLMEISGDYPNIEVLFDREAEMMYSLGIQAFPTSFYFDGEGNIISSRIGHNENTYIDSVFAGLE